jgi:starch phosphorylase
MPRTLHTYTVTPTLPERLAALRTLAYNLRWSWDAASIQLFRQLGGNDLWEEAEHNPARLLGLVPQTRFEEAAADPAFLATFDAVIADFEAYIHGTGWWGATHAAEFGSDFKIAYFSAEFGLTECLPIYSGGLGVLAGDHLKAASDLGLPLVAVGFLYQRGYFRQGLNADGWQVENYPITDFYSLPITPLEDANGPLTIAVDFPGRKVFAQLWKAQVGRIPLYLLDTNVPQNAEPDRHIAGNLYGGDNETRIQQEIVLGIGGVHALAAAGITPTVCHMNEGHSAFLSLERIRRLVEDQGLSFDDAASAAGAGNLFTTHTPVPAGFDLFPTDLMYRYFADYAGRLGLSFESLMDRGRHPQGDANKFNMAVLAFRQARYINGVSRLHGAVSRQMAASVWNEFPLDEVPVGSVTNGIHTRSFLSAEMRALLDRYLGTEPDWSKVETIPDSELWAVKTLRRHRLVEFARRHQVGKITKRGGSDREVDDARAILDPDILTIGFARRFATYKRGDLLLRDVERIKRLVSDSKRPVQFVFAGKAHPRDDAGKELIQRIVHFAKDPAVRGRVVFLEDYDMAMARYLVQGVDVWLNNPRRPMEASGTSGMKVVPNGGLNFSVLDGWWAEAYEPSVGWAIGRGEDYDDLAYQDHVEAIDIYETLEEEIIPLFYDRGDDGLPTRWIARVKSSIATLSPVYSTQRMVTEYTQTYYVPAARLAAALSADGFARAKALVAWKKTLRQNWSDVRIEAVEPEAEKLAAGQTAGVRVVVRLGGILSPDDVTVELYAGPVDADRNLIAPRRIVLPCTGTLSPGVYGYAGTLPSERSGQQGFTVRVLPSHPDAVLPQELPLVTWE